MNLMLYTVFMLISQGNKHEFDMIAQFKFLCV